MKLGLFEERDLAFEISQLCFQTIRHDSDSYNINIIGVIPKLRKCIFSILTFYTCKICSAVQIRHFGVTEDDTVTSPPFISLA